MIKLTGCIRKESMKNMFERITKEKENELYDGRRYLRKRHVFRRTKCNLAFGRSEVAHALKRVVPAMLMLLFSMIPGAGVASAIETIWQMILSFIT